jgi:hypothetical protein
MSRIGYWLDIVLIVQDSDGAVGGGGAGGFMGA